MNVPLWADETVGLINQKRIKATQPWINESVNW